MDLISSDEMEGGADVKETRNVWRNETSDCQVNERMAVVITISSRLMMLMRRDEKNRKKA